MNTEADADPDNAAEGVDEGCYTPSNYSTSVVDKR